MAWFFTLLISVPMFLASPFFLMRSGLSLPLRLLLSFWIVAIRGYHLAAYLIESLKVHPEVFLIPSGYRGKVTILFDDPNGAPPERESGKIIYRIGAGGQLRTRVHDL